MTNANSHDLQTLVEELSVTEQMLTAAHDEICRVGGNIPMGSSQQLARIRGLLRFYAKARGEA